MSASQIGNWAAVSLGCSLLLGCGPSEEDKKLAKMQADKSAQFQAEQKVFATLDGAEAATEKSVRQHVHYVADGVIQAYDVVPELGHTFPATTPWMWNCGLTGAQLHFGGMSPSGDNEDKIDNNIHITVASVPVEKPICDALAPRVAQLLKDIGSEK